MLVQRTTTESVDEIVTYNPSSPNSDQHQFSPNDNHPLSRDKLWELIKWSQREKSLIFYQILSTNSLRKCIEISLENLYVDIGA